VYHSDTVVHDRRSTDLPINSIVSVAIVQDPYSDTGEQLQVLRSLRDDPLAAMIARGQIDEAQFQAGRKWQKLHDCSTIGVIRAIDPAKEAVDGGGRVESITDRQISAFTELRESYEALGTYGKTLVFYVLGEGLNITQAAVRMNCSTESEVKYIGRRFRECLESLAILWGFAQPKYR